MTLQWRLTLLSFLLTAGAVLALAAGAYLVARERVHQGIDDGLSARTQALVASIGISHNPLSAATLSESRRSLDAQAALGAVFRISDPSGAVLYSSRGTMDQGEQLSLESGPGFLTREGEGGRTRLLVRPLLAAGQPVGYVEATASLTQADESLASLREALAGAGVTVALVTGIIAYFTTGRAVQPVRDVARLAREIERTADFSRRLPETKSAREMQEMSRTFNRMIDRVERLIQTQRSFLSDTSHELRRPLTILRTNLDVINEPALSPPEREAVRREMGEVVDSMSLLLSELLLLARQDEESLKLDPTDLTAVCTQAMKAISQSHPGHTYRCELAADVWVLADRERLYRAISNLLQNAAIYTEKPGEVTLNLQTDHGEARILVADTGPGMTPEDVEHAFERFYRGTGARRARPDGLGLGLAIVKQVLDSHEASLDINSALGAGTQIEVRLPLLGP